MTKPKLLCPNCGHGHIGSILYRVKKDSYLCKLCGHQWKREAAQPDTTHTETLGDA